MGAVLIVPAVVQLAVPIALLVWQAASRDRSRLAWALKTVAVMGYIAATAMAGLWLLSPWYVPHIFGAASLLVAAIRFARPLRSGGRLPARQRLFLAGRGVAAVLAAGAAWAAVESRQPPGGELVDLAFPLRNGTYYIANGGATALTNAHVFTLDVRYFKYRGQSYGVDIVKLNPYGYRADALAPRDPARYEIFGDAVYAPCDGSVARVEDWLPDMQPPDVDRAHMPGNFVLLECDDIQVLVGHLRDGSVKVHPGDYVTVDTMLGAVGNSGNSNEPHLHIHAQRPGLVWSPFIGDPLPIRLDGRYLVRNDRIVNVAPFAGFGGDEID